MDADSANLRHNRLYHPSTANNIFCYFAPSTGAKYCDQHVCMSVCLSVCPLTYLEKRMSKFHEIFRTLPVTVALMTEQ